MATNVISPEKKQDELTGAISSAAMQMGSQMLKNKIDAKTNPRDRRMVGGGVNANTSPGSI